MDARVAVVCERDGAGAVDAAAGTARASALRAQVGAGAPGAAAVTAYLEAAGIADAAWFSPRDVDDVDAGVRRREVERVVFDAPATFLTALWNRRIDYESWQRRGVTPEFAALTRDAAGAVDAAARAWEAWDRRRRRLQVAGGLLLSAIALAAAFVVLWASAA